LITQDQWVLNAVKGYRIEFLQRPVQYRNPPQLTFTEKEEKCMLAEIQNMLGKKAISLTAEGPEDSYSHITEGRQRPVINQ
jgi:hypothetical protein